VNHQIFERRMRSRDIPGSTPLPVPLMTAISSLQPKPGGADWESYTRWDHKVALKDGKSKPSVSNILWRMAKVYTDAKRVCCENDVVSYVSRSKPSHVWSSNEQARVRSTFYGEWRRVKPTL